MKTYMQSPIGILEIEEKDGFICSLRIIDSIPDKTPNIDTPLLIETQKQLNEYFAGERKSFDIPTKQAGTAFQQRAWAFLDTIPYGETVSYKQEAEAVGSPKGYRATGSANGKNHIPIIIPCHRVINEGGGLGGFAYDIAIKKHLLEIEKLNK